jgi:hypothetical protein
MAAVTTSIDALTGGVTISWVAPSSNSESIDAYIIKISDSTNSNYYEDTTDCDGSTTTVITNMACTIPMSTLTSSPYNLVFGDLVDVIASAHNSNGYGSYSPDNTAGATIRTVPAAMATPTRGTSTTASQIEIDWTALTLTADTGNSAITSYNL